jgi:hypothetical protein
MIFTYVVKTADVSPGIHVAFQEFSVCHILFGKRLASGGRKKLNRI